MKHFFLYLLFFACFGVLFYIGMIIIFGCFAPRILKTNLNYQLAGYGHLYTRLKEADTTKNVDVLVLGTSHAYRGYDTRIFKQSGLKIFNLGSSAQSLLQTEILTQRYIDHMHPKFVVIDVYPIVIGSDGVESALDLIANSKIDWDICKMALQINNIKVYNDLIYAYFRQVFKLNQNYNEPVKKGRDTYIGGGYIETNLQYHAKPFKKITYNINDKQVAAFESVLGILKKKNIPYILIQAPVYRGRYDKVVNNSQLDSFYSKYGKYYNLNNVLKLPDTLFSDDSHLNQTGVDVFDKEVLKVIDSNDKSLINLRRVALK